MSKDLERRLVESVIRTRPERAARVVEGLDPAAAARIIEELRPDDASALLRSMLPPSSGKILAELRGETARKLLLAMPIRSAAAFLRRLPTEKSSALLEMLPADRGRKVRILVDQRTRTAGALADPDVLVLTPTLSAGEALARCRVELIHTTHELPVVDDEYHLLGMVAPRDLTAAKKTQTIGAIMKTRYPRLSARTPSRSITAHADWKSHSALPVVDASGTFIGMLSLEAARAVQSDLPTQSGGRKVSTSEALGDLFSVGVEGMVDALFNRARTDQGDEH